MLCPARPMSGLRDNPLTTRRFDYCGPQEYPTQYAGMMGSAPERLEIDTSDTEMGQRWQDQLAALEARLGAVVQEQAAYQQSHEQGMRY